MNDTKRKLLILDLDETLIFSNTQSLVRKADFKIDGYYVYKRPNLNPFLKFCFFNFDVAVLTLSVLCRFVGYYCAQRLVTLSAAFHVGFCFAKFLKLSG